MFDHYTRISVSRIHEALVGQGFDIDKRSIQRDLKAMANLFAIESDGNKDIPGWYWKKDAEKLELPEMEPAVALSFRMVKSFLDRFMPPSTLDDLGDYFNHADRVLASLPENNLSDWTDKVALLSRNQPLISPTISDDILNKVYTALLNGKQGRFEYLIEAEKTIKLKLVLSEKLAFHLTESPLSEDQTIKPDKETGRVILRAEVKNTQQLRWWLMSFGDGVEVLAPKALRQEFADQAQRLALLYQN